MRQSKAHSRPAGVLAIAAAAALLAVALAGCGVGRTTSREEISKTTTTYLKALAAGDTTEACGQLTRRARRARCAAGLSDRLARLDPSALRRAADGAIDIQVHGGAATAVLARPRGARLVLARAAGAWRIDAGYLVPAPASPSVAAAVVVGGGRLVDIGGGRRLYLRCVGSGSPTLVLEAGFPGDSESWRDIQPQLSRKTRTCAYDRAGLGNSGPTPGVHDARDETMDLQRLLDAAHIQAPYVLVGHSYGGMLARLFAHEHADETAGVVLVDARGRDATRRQLAIWPASVAPAVRRDVFRPVQHGVDLAAGEALVSRVRNLGHTPLAVVTAGRHDDEWGRVVPPPLAHRLDRLWTKMQDELAALSSDHVHVVALHSDHFVQRLDGQPNLVIRTIDAVVDAARYHTQLPTCQHLFSGSGVHCR
jgi:pimeloyl-ACP methyl ester carboxylesterase